MFRLHLKGYISVIGIVVSFVLIALLITKFLSSNQNNRENYLFGTLETANGRAFTNLGLSAVDIAKKEHGAGVAIAMVTLAWKDYETFDGVFNESELAHLAKVINRFLQAGQKIDVQLAIHYAPSWLTQIPDACYVNQYGDSAPQPCYTFPNYIFNAIVRQKVWDFETHALQQLQKQVGLSNIWDFRIDGGDGGEALYPAATDSFGHPNSYWAYDNNAQGKGNALPLGISHSPFPGWQPGQTLYNGQPFTPSQVQQWYDWYFHSRMNFYNWQIALYRNAGFPNYLTIETPGFGTRPDEYRKNITHYLDGEGDPNGTMSRAAVWQNLYPALLDKNNIIAYISSMGDNSGATSPLSGQTSDNLCQPSDMHVNFNTDPIVDTWNAVRYVSYIANKYGFLKGGENPGWNAGGDPHYGITMMDNAAKQMASCGLIGMFWAHDDRLYTAAQTSQTSSITLTDYASIINQYNFRTVRVGTGAAYTDSQKNPWSADRGFTTSNTGSSSTAIADTPDPTLYQSYRYGNLFSYNFLLANACYGVMLKFAETQKTRPGQRIFDVAINGTPVLTHFDVLSQVPPNTALDKTFLIAVTHKNVKITFHARTGTAMVSAIQIVPVPLCQIKDTM